MPSTPTPNLDLDAGWAHLPSPPPPGGPAGRTPDTGPNQAGAVVVVLLAIAAPFALGFLALIALNLAWSGSC